MVKGELNLHKQLSFVWDKPCSVDTGIEIGSWKNVNMWMFHKAINLVNVLQVGASLISLLSYENH